MGKMLGAFDPKDFWEQSDYALKKYVDAPPTKEEVAAIEKELGYKLPPAYVELAQYQNGGIPKKINHRTKERTTRCTAHLCVARMPTPGRMRTCAADYVIRGCAAAGHSQRKPTA